MTISSRTPEGEPNKCPICGAQFALEPSATTNDAPCPNCGHLLWWFQEHLSDPLTMPREAITAETLLQEGNSLDLVELIMELKEEFDITIPEDDAQTIQTVGNAIRYIEARRDKHK